MKTLKFIGKDVILNHYSITLSFNNYQNESDVRFKKRGDVKRLEDVAFITMGQSPDGKFYNKKGNGLEFHQEKQNFQMYLLNTVEFGVVNTIERQMQIQF